MTKKERTVQLLKGTFSFDNAADVLFSLIMHKIKFHQLQISNDQTLTSDDLRRSKIRIEELKESKRLVKEMILMSRDEGYDLEIDSAIHIKLVKNSKSIHY